LKNPGDGKGEDEEDDSDDIPELGDGSSSDEDEAQILGVGRMPKVPDVLNTAIGRAKLILDQERSLLIEKAKDTSMGKFEFGVKNMELVDLSKGNFLCFL
jgi:hypothetical protein